MELKNYDELKMFPVCNNGGGESRSLVFKISRSLTNPTNENLASSLNEISKPDVKHILKDDIWISVSEENKKTVTPDFEPVTGKTSKDTAVSIQKDIQLEIMPEVEIPSNVEVSPTVKIAQEAEIPHSSVKQVKVSQVRRRSLRLLTLESRLKSSQNSNCVKIEMSNEYPSKKKKDPALSVNASSKLTATVTKKTPQGNKRIKNSLKSAPAPKCRRKSLSNSETSNNNQINTRKLKLKSMLILPTLRNPSPSSSNVVGQNFGISTPKFANVDPSRVMSTLLQPGNAFIEPGKPVSVFFTSEHPTQVPRPGQGNTSRENLYVHHLNKGKKDLAYLCKKYHMLDHVTLDNCYGMSNCSLKRTEIMLSEIISGKEDVVPRNGYRRKCPCVYMNDVSSIRVMTPDSVSLHDSCQKSKQPFCDPDSLCRKIIVRSMYILCSEEAVL